MKLYNRVLELKVGNIVLTYPPVTIEFEISFQGNASGKVKVYNPSDELIQASKAKEKIIIDAGYRENYGTVFTGEVIKPEIKKGSEPYIEITIGDKTSLWINSIVNKSYSGPIYASKVILDIFDSIGVLPGALNLKDDYRYERGISFTNDSLRSVMNRIAKDTQSTFFFRQGYACFLEETKGYERAIDLSIDTGLISVKERAKGFSIRSLFIYQIMKGSLINLHYNDAEYPVKVTKGKHKFSPISNAITEVEVIKL